MTLVHPGMIQQPYRRNVIINGDMRIHQRVNTYADTNATYSANVSRMIADRFQGITYAISTGQVFDVAANRGTDPLVGTYIESVNNIVGTFAAAPQDSASLFTTLIEGYDVSRLYGKNCVLSFDFYASTAGSYCVTILEGAATASYVHIFTVPAATFTRIEVPFFLDTTVGGPWNSTNGWGIQIQFGGINPAGSVHIAPQANTWLAGNYHSVAGVTDWTQIAGFTARLTNVQLEEGTVATPFEHRPFAEELLLCKRYFERINMYPGGEPVVFELAANNTGFTNIRFEVEKRLIPTITWQNIGINNPQIATVAITGVNSVSTRRIGGLNFNGTALGVTYGKAGIITSPPGYVAGQPMYFDANADFN